MKKVIMVRFIWIPSFRKKLFDNPYKQRRENMDFFRAARIPLPFASEAVPPFTKKGYSRLRVDVKNKEVAAVEYKPSCRIVVPASGKKAGVKPGSDPPFLISATERRRR
jgi:hypothetical protein